MRQQRKSEARRSCERARHTVLGILMALGLVGAGCSGDPADLALRVVLNEASGDVTLVRRR